MAVTVDVLGDGTGLNGDFELLHAMESTSDQDVDGAGNNFSTLGQINNTIFVEGTASTPYQAKNVTNSFGFAGTWNTGNNWDAENKHLYSWVRSLDPFQVEGYNTDEGMIIRASNASNGASPYKQWEVGGQDTRRATVEGFIRLCVDMERTADESAGTLDHTSFDGIYVGGTLQSGSGQNTYFVDAFHAGSFFRVYGGTTGARGTSTEVSDVTDVIETGIFKDIGDPFFILSGLKFGDNGTGSSYFKDLGEVWYFEAQNVGNDHYTITIDGNSTGTNSFELGNKTGSGKDTTGTGGNTLLATQEAFNFVITDANVDTCLLAGCNFLNAGTEQGTFNITNGNAEAVSCLFSACSEITLDNSPLFVNNTIANSTPPSTGAAVDLNTTKPSANTFANNAISGSSSHNLRIEGSSTTGDSWDLDNIQMAGATTADILVDYPAQTGGNKVTINLLNGSSAGSSTQIAVTGGISLSDVVLANAKAITVAGVTEGTPVKVIANETVGTVTVGDVIMEEFADSDGIATGSIDYEAAFNPSGLDVLVSARNQGVAAAAIAEDGGVFTDETDEAHSNAGADMTLLPATPVANDAYNFGSAEQFNRLKLNISTALAGTGVTFAFEYWNGTIWTAVSDLVDGTSGLTLTGENIISWTMPSNWAQNTINTQGPLYYFRIRLSALTTITTTPVGSRVTLDISRYLPYDVERVITESGLADNASWQPDNISKFDPND